MISTAHQLPKPKSRRKTTRRTKIRESASADRAAVAAADGRPFRDIQPSAFGRIAQTRWSETLIFRGAAIKGAERSSFKNTELMFEACELLATHYRGMHISGEPEARAAYERRLRELGLDWHFAVTKRAAGLAGDRFLVTFPELGGKWGRKKILLRHHLRFGAGRDPRHLLRVYFAWHQPTQRVLVGHLPTHL